LSALLKAAGIRDYSIFLDSKKRHIICRQKLTRENTADDLPKHPLMKRWWAYIADIMETNPDNSPVSSPIAEVSTRTNYFGHFPAGLQHGG